MKTKILNLFLLLIASIGTMFASDTQVDGIWYNFNNSKKTATVTYRGSSYDSYINEYSGTIDIPSSVTYNETTYSVTSIGEEAFYGCYHMTSVTIPNSVTSIGYEAFSGCSNLTSVTIPNSVTYIHGWAFANCTGLTSVTIPNSITSIGERAFSGCSGLMSVNIPNSVTDIGSGAFSECVGLTSINVDANNQKYNSIDGVLFNKDKTTLIIYPGGKQGAYSIPIGVTSIGNYAFSGCSGLVSITIPNSVTSIGNNAYNGCSGLTSVTIPYSVRVIGESAFYSCSGLTSINVDANNQKYNSIDGVLFNKDKTTLIIYPSGKQGAYSIPISVAYIKEKAFEGCSGLTFVTIPNSVTSIGGSAFSGCSSMTSVTIPNSVTSIGYEAFSGCSNLTSMTIGNSVTRIGNCAFVGCSGLTSVVWNAKNIVDFKEEATPFYSKYNCTAAYDLRGQITSFIFGNEVEHIPAFLCSEMKRLTSIRIPSEVTSIGKDAFKGCNGIVSVIWEAKNCSSSPHFGPQVESFLFGNEVERIPLLLCLGMSQLTSVSIPNSVKTIGNDAFNGCSDLQTLTLGENITTYGSSAFSGCSALTSIYNYRRTPVALSADVFKNVDYFACTLYVMEGSVDMYKSDRSSWKDFFYNIEPISATSTTSGDDIQITPTDNTANIVWPQVNGAETYELVIKDKSGNIICTLIFNAQGQLTSIAFGAPSRNNVPQQTQTAGFAFTVTGLNSGTNYDLVMTSKNSNGGTIQTKTVSFTTTGEPQGVEEVLSDQVQSTKVVRNGQIFILRGDKIYTLQGQEIIVP